MSTYSHFPFDTEQVGHRIFYSFRGFMRSRVLKLLHCMRGSQAMSSTLLTNPLHRPLTTDHWSREMKMHLLSDRGHCTRPFYAIICFRENVRFLPTYPHKTCSLLFD